MYNFGIILAFLWGLLLIAITCGLIYIGIHFLQRVW